MTQAVQAHTTNRAITVTDLAIQGGDARVHDLRIADALGFTNRHIIRTLIKRHAKTLAGFGELICRADEKLPQGGRPGRSYYLNKRQALFITAKSDTERAALVTVQMVEVFDEATRTDQGVSAIQAPEAPASVPRALPAPTKGIGIVKLNRVIWFDTRRRPNIGELALVVRHNGELGVYPVVASERQYEEGYVYVQDKTPEVWRMSIRSRVSLVGAVITADGKVRRGPRRIAA